MVKVAVAKVDNYDYSYKDVEKGIVVTTHP